MIWDDEVGTFSKGLKAEKLKIKAERVPSLNISATSRHKLTKSDVSILTGVIPSAHEQGEDTSCYGRNKKDLLV